MQDVKKEIFASITKEAVPIHLIAQRANVSVQTASKYCYILQAEGKITMTKFGNMKLVRRAGK